MRNTVQKMEALSAACESEAEFDMMLDKIVDVRLSRYRSRLERYERELNELERKHDMDSEEFQRRFESGELGDDMEYFEWNGMIELRNDLVQKMRRLEVAR